MTHTTLDYDKVKNLGALDRFINAVLGSCLIGFVFTQGAPAYLGWFALLPLFAIYPCLASMTGFSPVRAAIYVIGWQTKAHWDRYFAGHNEGMNALAH